MLKAEVHLDSSEKEAVLFSFYDLSLRDVRKFLKGTNYEYELRDCKTGNYIFISKSGFNTSQLAAADFERLKLPGNFFIGRKRKYNLGEQVTDN